MSQINYSAIFDNVDLTTVNGLTVLATNPYLPAKRKINISELAQSDKSKTSSAFFTDRKINIRVGIQRDNRAQLEASIDSLMSILQGQEKQLVLAQSGTQRTYTATYSDYSVNIHGGAYCELDLLFATSAHFGYDTTLTQLVYAAGATLYNRTDSFTVGGSAYYQTPIIKVTISAVTGGTTSDVILKNPANGQAVTVNRTWVAGDLLVVDSQNKTVTVNGSNVDFSGAIPEWRLGVGYLQYTDGFLTRTVTIYAYYYKRWV